MTNKILFFLMLIPWLSISPAEVGNSTPIDHILQPILESYPNPQEQKIDSLERVKQVLREEMARLAKQPKIIYRTKEIKPKKITLYVRDSAGGISEHKVTSDGGFYIINASELKPDTNEAEIQIEEDTVRKDKGWLKNIFK